MKLVTIRVKNFRSIEDSTEIAVDPQVTSFVGLNESGKTCILQSTHKALRKDGEAKFIESADFPRRRWAEYQRRKDRSHADVVTLDFQLSDSEVEKFKTEFGKDTVKSNTAKLTVNFDNKERWSFPHDEVAYVKHLVSKSGLGETVVSSLNEATTARELILKVSALPAEEKTTEFKNTLAGIFKNQNGDDSLLSRALDERLRASTPSTFYFDDYFLLPGKINLQDLIARIGRKDLQEEHTTVIALLEVAGVKPEELISPSGYEPAKAKLEAISAEITDKVLQFWLQNKDLSISFDVRDDTQDSAPFNNGKNLYIRIENKRHRVTMPLSNRSKGFIWFFSFLVWFERMRMSEQPVPAILLLDEPGLNLHALGQADLLTYIETLSKTHQVLYSTHSPFMIESVRLDRTRVVEDKEKEGTQVTSNLAGSSRNTLFPLQAALGYTIAQNLFISPNNLLVEGPSDLVLLNFFTAKLEAAGKSGLRSDVTIVPVGGGGKIATFVALLNANKLKNVILTDYAGKPEPTLTDLVRQKIIRENILLDYAMFRDATNKPSTDVEDLIPAEDYVKFYNEVFGSALKFTDLPKGDRILDRIARATKVDRFNHYRVAEKIASPGTYAPSAATLAIFEKLFAKVNTLLG